MNSKKQILLECTICLEEFKDPRFINCHHSFCLTCLEDFIKIKARNSKFNCPVCRMEISVPNGGADKFPANFYINVMRENEICETKEKSGAPSNEFCDIHPKKMYEFYCHDCEVVICSKCAIGTHKSHVVFDVELPEVRQIIYDKMSTARADVIKIQKAFGDYLDNTKELLKHLVSAAEEEIVNISKHVEMICQGIQKKGDNVIEVIRKDIINNTTAVEEFEKNVKDVDGFLDEKHSLSEMVNITQLAKRLAARRCNPCLLQFTQFQKSTSLLYEKDIGSMLNGICMPIVKVSLKNIHFGQTIVIPEWRTEFQGNEYHLELTTLLEDLYMSLVLEEEVENGHSFVASDGRDCSADDADNDADDEDDFHLEGVPYIGDADNDADYEDDFHLEGVPYFGDDDNDDDDDLNLDGVRELLGCFENEVDGRDESYSITLVNTINEAESISRTREDDCWRFLKWDTLLDPANGFIDSENNITVKVAKYYRK